MKSFHTVDYNIEYAHIYSSDLYEKNSIMTTDILKTINIIRTIEANNLTYSLNVLVDDYSQDQYPVSKDIVMNLFTDLGLVPDHIVMESELTKEADYLLNTLPSKNLFKEDNRFVLKTESNDIHFSELLQEKKRYKTIEMEKMLFGEEAWNNMQQKDIFNLKQHRVYSKSNLILVYKDGINNRYSCPLLAACWYLARLGVEPFLSSITNSLNDQRLFIGKNLLTVLNISFLKVESTALELIGLSKSKLISQCKKKIEYYFTS